MTSVNRLLLVRHGENPANLTKEFSCRKVDYPLTDRGVLQARQTAEFLAGFSFDEIWTSPLKRAHQTATEIARGHAQSVRVHEGLREMDVGVLEGMEPQDRAWQIYAETMRRWLSGEVDFRFPEGESRRELCGRLRSTLDFLTSNRSDRTLLMVGHGGIFTHGVAELCGIEDQRAFLSKENHNCSVSTLDVVREAGGLRFVLVDWASVGHLSGEAARVVESVPESFQVKNL